MAAKKKVSKKKTGMAKRANTNIVDIKKQLQAEAAGISDNIGSPETNAIKIKDKVFTMPDGTIIQDSLDVVVVDFVSRNNYYEGKWDPKNPEPPACYAIGKVVKALVPSKQAADVQVRGGKSCDECPMNQWGSDGDGKACKNTRLIAVVLPDDAEKKLYTMSIPPTAIKSFDGFVGSVAKLFELPPIGVVATITFHQDKSYPLPLFGDVRPNEHIQDDFAFRPDAETMLMAEVDYPPSEGKKKTRRK